MRRDDHRHWGKRIVDLQRFNAANQPCVGGRPRPDADYFEGHDIRCSSRATAYLVPSVSQRTLARPPARTPTLVGLSHSGRNDGGINAGTNVRSSAGLGSTTSAGPYPPYDPCAKDARESGHLSVRLG